MTRRRHRCSVGPCSACKPGEFATKRSSLPIESESSIQRKILAYLHQVGLNVWRTNAGSVNVGVRGAPNGTADIIGLTNDGRFMAIEVKREDGKLSPAQIAWHDDIKARGGLCGVARSVSDAASLLHLWGVL